MLRMIEFHVEVFVKAQRKSFEWSRRTLDVAVADDTHRTVRGYKLREMTFGAGVVAGKLRCG